MTPDELRNVAELIRRNGGDTPLFSGGVAMFLEDVAAWTDEGLGHVAGLERTNWPDMWHDLQVTASIVARNYPAVWP